MEIDTQVWSTLVLWIGEMIILPLLYQTWRSCLKIEAELHELHEMHTKSDPSGRPLWYVPPEMLENQRRIVHDIDRIRHIQYEILNRPRRSRPVDDD